MAYFRRTILFACTFTFAALAQGYIALVGGGTENYNSWSDAPYGWMVEKGDSGKVLVLSYRDESNWIPDYFVSLGASQAVNLKITSTSQANDSSVYNEILTAKVLFLKGGDQYQYYSKWRNTLTEQAIEQVYQNGGVIAGTSAGAMAISEIMFTSQNGTVYPEEVLRNPYNSYVTLRGNFLSILPGIFVDTHVVERGRTGRMIGFLARWNQDNNADILAVGVDDRTALLINPDKTAEVAGSGAVTFFWQTPLSEVRCLSGQPLHFTDVAGCQLTAGYRFDLNSRSITYMPPDAIPVDPTPPPLQLPAGEIRLQGGVDFGYQSGSGNVLTDFLQAHPGLEKMVILCDINAAAVDRANAYRDWFLANGVDSAWVQSIYIGNVNNPDVVAKVAAAEALLLTGNHELFIGDLLNGGNGLSVAFQSKIQQGTPLFAIGVDAKMVSANLVGATESSTSNLFYGNLKWSRGAAVWQNALVMSRAFDDHDYKENRIGGLFWGLFKSPKSLGALMDERTTLTVRDSLATVAGEAPVIFIDPSSAAYIDSSDFAFGSNPRQCVTIDSYRWHVIAPGESFNWVQRQPFITAISGDPAPELPQQFALDAAYPNPFNGAVSFRLQVRQRKPMHIRIFDVTGRRIAEFNYLPLTTGENTWRWQPAGNIASGAYFFTFQQGQTLLGKAVHYVR